MTGNLWDQAEVPPAPRDPCAGRHGGAETSEQAWERTLPTLPRRQAEVLAEVRAAGAVGRTSKEIAASLGVGLNAISGRLSELLALGLIVDSRRRREGCRVLVAREVAHVAV